MDRHEKGLEKVPGRLDQALPDWNGSYSGNVGKLPKVVQKLMHGVKLSAEEKAELLWRFFELEQRGRQGRAWMRRILIAIPLIAGAAYVAIYQWRWVVNQVMAWLSPPAAPPA